MMRIAAFFLLFGWLTSLSSVVYGQCDSFSVELRPTHPTCESVQNGALTVVTNNATPPINYTWSDGASEDTRTSLGTGDYEVTVTDADGCTAVESVTLTGLMELDLGGDTTLYCEDGGELVLGDQIIEPSLIDCLPFPGTNEIFINGVTNFGVDATPGYVNINPPITTPNNNSLQLYVESVQAMAGDTVYVPIVTVGTNGMPAVFVVHFDPTFLNYISTISSNSEEAFEYIEVNPGTEAGTLEAIVNLFNSNPAPDTIILFELAFQVQGTLGNYEYEWAGPDGFSADTSVITATTSGTYSLTLTESGNSGCVLQDS
ncbi:MAG TPA: hypothetical protein VJ933_09300, partial [Phaeodactylibacter sp.]|nr:hypothetical protein [Phaeodactylibacter sp.]